MKKLLYLIVIILSFKAYSQKYTNIFANYKAIYNFKLKTDSTSNHYDSINLSLYLNNKKSVVQDFFKDDFDSIVVNQQSQYYNLNNSSYGKVKSYSVILKDYEKQELTFSEIIGKEADNLGYVEKLPLFSWKIEKEEKKILGYNCRKATTRHRGRNYIAWYTSEIPFQDGPYKFSGLPGLIVEIYDNKYNFVFTLISFTKIKKNILYDTKIIYTKREKILPAKLNAYYNLDIKYYIPEQNTFNNIKNDNKQEIIINPIELE